MSGIFLGKPRYWALLVIAAVLLIAMGEVHWHVSRFNLFMILTLLIGAVLVLAVVFGHRPGERMMREPLPDLDESDR